MAPKIRCDLGSSDLYRPNPLTENFGPRHNSPRSGRETPDQVRSRFHWALLVSPAPGPISNRAWKERWSCQLPSGHPRCPPPFHILPPPGESLLRWVMSPISPGMSYFPGTWFVLTSGSMTGTSLLSLALPLSKFIVVSWRDILKYSATFSPFPSQRNNT